MVGKKRFLFWLGNLLTALGILLVVVPVLPAVVEEIKFRLVRPQVIEEVEVAENWQLVIPKIGARAKVVAEVDPLNKDEYLAALKEGVAHAKGSVKPGEQGTTFLFAHSTDSVLNIKNYNAVFYLLNKLEAGDEVWVDYQGERFVYQVVGKEVIATNDERYGKFFGQVLHGDNGGGLRHSGPPAGGDPESQLVLQTCWPPGTTWKRLLVRGELVGAI